MNMTRNLKALGLALMAAFAMSAVAASAASAQTNGKLTADGPVTLTGVQTGEELANSLTAFGDILVCKGSTYTGHRVISQETTEKDPGKEHELIEPGESTATITPHYKDCTQPGTTRHVVVDMNGCDYVFHVGETTGGEHTYGVTADVVCPPNQKIKVTVWNQATSILLCEITVGAQNGLKGAHLKHTTSPADDIDLEGKFEGVHAQKHGLCLFGATSTTTTAQLHVDVTITGHDIFGDPTPVTITH